MGCVSSVRFDVLLNGMPGNHFNPSRGLRQRDPLSPLLFLLVGEVFSRVIQGAVEKNNLNGIRMGYHGPMVSHLFFCG